MNRREFAVAFADPFVAPLAWTVVEDWVEEYKHLRFAGDPQIICRIVETRHDRCDRCQVSASRTASCSDSFRVDPQFSRMCADVAYCRFCILTTDSRWARVAVWDRAIFNSDSD